jgi:peptidoglycan/xylan/chitin deacetylase (PgdA/CDA1 family)
MSRRVRATGRGVILHYHRVAESSPDFNGLCVAPEQFERQLQFLCEHGTPLPLEVLVKRTMAGDAPSNAFAITFDDGYADNLHEAAPMLKSAGVPATVFVATGCLASTTGFWWDELEALVLASPRLPAAIELTGDGARSRIRTHGPWALLSRIRRIHAPPRYSLYLTLRRKLLRLRHEERLAALAQLRSQLGTANTPLPRIMSAPDVAAISRQAGISIGAHTVTHPVLAAQSRSEQYREISDSRSTLESITGAPVRTFAYPFGSRRDFSELTVQLVREAGFALGCTTLPGTVGPDSDSLLIPRVSAAASTPEALGRSAGWL